VDIWIWDLARAAITRLTFHAGNDTSPVWSPDGRHLIFAASGPGPSNLYRQAADGAGTVERLTESRNPQSPSSITPDGTEILLGEVISGQTDLMQLPLASQRLPTPSVSKPSVPLVHTMFNERNAELAPKGQWLAYESNESGRYEIYVRPFPNVEAGRWQVSTNGGTMPLWARSGDELFYLAADRTIQSVRVDGSSSWRRSTPTKVLQGRYLLPSTRRRVCAAASHHRRPLARGAEATRADELSARANLLLPIRAGLVLCGRQDISIARMRSVGTLGTFAKRPQPQTSCSSRTIARPRTSSLPMAATRPKREWRLRRGSGTNAIAVHLDRTCSHRAHFALGDSSTH